MNSLSSTESAHSAVSVNLVLLDRDLTFHSDAVENILCHVSVHVAFYRYKKVVC